jgi:hypothetical protein
MIASMDDPAALSRLELVSLYINRYYQLDADLRSRFEAEFLRRKLPLPAMPAAPARPCRDRRGASRPMSRGCFLSYVLLIYSGTAFFYSWAYLAARLVKMDYAVETRHKLVQTAIALIYVVGELLLYGYIFGSA